MTFGLDAIKYFLFFLKKAPLKTAGLELQKAGFGVAEAAD